MSDSPLLTAAELAERLKVNRRTIYRLIKEDRIPKTRIGGQWRFDWAKVILTLQQATTSRNPTTEVKNAS